MNCTFPGVCIDDETLRYIKSLDDEGKARAITEIIDFYMDDKSFKDPELNNRVVDHQFMQCVHQVIRDRKFERKHSRPKNPKEKWDEMFPERKKKV